MTERTDGLDPATSLAMTVQSQPGVYALLLGSGISTGAGIPTGWGVVQDIVRRVAAAHAPEDPEAPDIAAENPEAWWQSHGAGEPLGYSNLLAAAAPTQAARRGLLAAYFEPSDEDLATGLKTPTKAHRAIAQLVKRGLIRVVITTNFDRLIERALEDVGVSPQVVSRPEAVGALTPLVHAPATVIKLHGDYADLGMRNTVEELADYPVEWKSLLANVFADYGLIVSGWSADWDVALVAALDKVAHRRYPLYWDSRSGKGEIANRLLAQHRGLLIPAASADALFTDLLERVDALDRLSEAPITTAVAVARLKRYLPDPARRIDLHDLITDAADRVVNAVAEQPHNIPGLDAAKADEVFATLRDLTTPLLALLVQGVNFDDDRAHTNLWCGAVQRLMQARQLPTGTYQELLDHARLYPALLALRTAGTVAVLNDRDDVLVELLTKPTVRDPYRRNERMTAVETLHEYRVIDSQVVNKFPRWGNPNGWIYPPSHLLRADLREVLRPLFADDAEYKWAVDRYEYRIAIYRRMYYEPKTFNGEAPGEYNGDYQWTQDNLPVCEPDFVASLTGRDNRSPWLTMAEAIGLDLEDTVTELREALREDHRRRW